MATVPGVPQIFIRPDVRNQQLLFFWDPPTSDGGSPITSYILSDGTITINITNSFGFYSLTSLINGQTYSFTLAASNAIGVGPTAAFRTVQPGNPPDVPTNPSYTAVGGNTFNITWTNPVNTGSASLLGTVLTAIPVDSNDVIITTNSNNYIRKSILGNSTSSGFINLNSSNNWKVSIRSVNDPGYSEDIVYTNTIITALGGSMVFSGTQTSFLSIANDVDLRFGTGDFTVEWFQYQTAAGSFPRPFSMGSYSPGARIAVSIESGTFYVWINGSAVFSASVVFLNQWVHFAICRSGTSLRVFRNGTQIGSTITNSSDINNTTDDLTIGNETTKSSGAAFSGRITNFRWVKGSALYTSNFTVPTSPLEAVTNTKLLLLASDSGSVSTDSSGLAKTIINSNVTWSNTNPF